MKRSQIKKTIILVSLILSALSLWSRDRERSFNGESASSVLAQDQQFLFIYIKKHQGLQLASRSFSEKTWKVREILPDPRSRFPLLKRDRKGEIWVVWEQGAGVSTGKLQQNNLIGIQKFTHGTRNIFPDIAFDLDNTPWLTWVCFFQEKSILLVQNLDSKKSWVVNPSLHSEASSPQIVVDSQNHPWIFWVGRKKTGRDEIFYSSFDGLGWSEPASLNRNTRYPHILPHAEVDSKGNIWVVWSAFDGNDYEIYGSSWNQNRWSPEKKISNNSSPDWAPFISFIRRDIPVVVWNQGSNRISSRYQMDGKWSQELILHEGAHPFSSRPSLSPHEETLILNFETQDCIIQKSFSSSDLINQKKFLPISFSPEMVLPSPHPEKYIGFGDSITYGYLDGEKAPEKGYIPRLESRLQKHFGPSEVINEGNPGESTVQGVNRIQEVIHSHPAKYLLLLEGTNDVIFRHISMNTTAFNLERMVLICQNSGVFPLLSTIPPRKDWEWNFKYYRQRIFSLNDKIRRIAEALNIPLVDHFQVFFFYPEKEGGWKSLLSKDGVHPSIKGYQIMTQTWFENIKTIPFPPLIVDIERNSDQILFYENQGNLIRWENNPKLCSENIFSGYKIYRAERSGPHPDFHLYTILQNPLQRSFFDTEIFPSKRYMYALSTIRKDGTEGPLSDPLEDTKEGDPTN